MSVQRAYMALRDAKRALGLDDHTVRVSRGRVSGIVVGALEEPDTRRAVCQVFLQPGREYASCRTRRALFPIPYHGASLAAVITSELSS